MSFFTRTLAASALLMACFVSVTAHAGGIVLGGTRIIYPAGQKEASISVRNTSSASRFMVQSWAENQHGNKTSDFIVTPPLYVSNPGSENTLRLMYAGPTLPTDRESLYYLTSKAIPAVDKAEISGKNVLMLSASTRIKLFVRPSGLKPSPAEAPSQLKVSRSGAQLVIRNPTPYYITITQIKAGNKAVKKTVMTPPFGTASLTLPSGGAGTLSFRTINDFGGITDEQIRHF
ncbi:fimbria/pilus periplasmic chaperone [Klebsiella indica]|uniref:fimbria/pilus periplasmic chaperone n=1 Tax=Klebsiella TaxID=570 RepID=UPI00115A3876|nr:fimbria/pilus periplasmic chaperone [Klebsiella sp. 2680]